MKRLLTFLWLIIGAVPMFSQGVSVAPTRIYFNNGLGESKTKIVTVLNKTNKPQSYQISFLDFDVSNNKGKPTLQKTDENPHSISPWISASPSYLTVQPGESMEIKVTLDIPNVPEANKVKWGAMSVKLAKEQVSPLDEQKQMGMAIVNTFQIIVYLFQTPPTITEKHAEIYDFKSINKDDEEKLLMEVENTSPSILDCYSYLEFTNLETGWSGISDKKHFTLLPDGQREVVYDIPKGAPKGKYSVMGVVDYGSSNEVIAAELEIEI